jgi:WD40 repeat protein
VPAADTFLIQPDAIQALARQIDGLRPGPGTSGPTAVAAELRRFVGHTDEVGCVAFSPDGKQALSGGKDNTIRLWDVATGKELYCFTGHTDSVSSVVFLPDARRALSSSYDQTMRLWQLPK